MYIDLTAAYDHIPRDFLFRVVQLRTGANHLVNIFRKMYENTTASIRGMNSKFDVGIGCRQGGQESPVLFNYYFDFVLKVAANAIDEAFPDGWGINMKYNIPHTCTNREQRQEGRMSGKEIIQWILYADDLVLFCKSVAEAEQLLNIINDTCLRFGLTISFKKTKTQVFNNTLLASESSLFSIGGNIIENIRSFVYLGQSTSNEEKGCFTEHRIARATAKFNEFRKVLTDSRVNMYTRRKILYASVRSRLTFGTQACLPKEHQMKKLEACWAECLRSMVGGGWRRKKTEADEEENYSFVYTNDDVMKITKAAPLRNYVYAQYLKYIGHICRSNNKSIVKKIFFSHPTRDYFRNPWIKISDLLGVSEDQAKRMTQSKHEFAELIRKQVSSTPW